VDLISLTLGLPLAPFRGLVALMELLRDEAERQLYDPSELRKQAEEIDSLVESGQISPAEGEQLQEQMLERVQVVPGESAAE
jgi:polyhydroxyalkanoate synthesis regulator phasin